MKLIDLHPEFIGSGGTGISDANGDPVPRREGVGVEFDCPCGNGSEDHRLFIPFTNPIGEGAPRTDRPMWERTGETFETLTLKPSIQRVGGCAWHGFVTNGETVQC